MTRAQVSIFIILGLVIAITIIAIFTIRSAFIKDWLNIEQEKTAEVPEQIKPIKSYIDSCLSTLSREAINTLGLQGGYIELPLDPIPRSFFNQFSNSLEIVPNTYTSYWFHETSNGIQKLEVPTIENMELDINNYITSKIDNCIKELFVNPDFSRYSIKFNSFPKTSTRIEDNFIEITLNYPSELYLDNIGKRIENYYVKLDIPLGYLYKTSKNILEVASQNNFFEKKTIDILSLYEEIPYGGVSLDCNSPTWTKSEVTKNLKDLVSANIGEIKLKDSDYILKNEAHKYFELTAGYSDSEINAFFLYSPQWPFEIEIYPSQGEILTSDELSNRAGNKATEILSGIFCLNHYNFVYDIKYPILITLSKDNYRFQFALQTIINNNQPKENKLGTLDLPESNIDVCSRKVTPVKVYALSEIQNELKSIEADISFQCFATTCPLGKTRTDENNEYSLTTLFPECLNGQVIAQNENYLTSKEFIDTNQETSVSVVLKPIHKFIFDIKVIEKSSGFVREIQENENFLIELESLEEDYKFYLTKENDEIKLVKGNYKVTAYISRRSDSPFAIESQEISKCIKIPAPGILGLFIKREKCIKTLVEGSQLDEVLTGAVQFNLKIDQSNIGKKITIYTIHEKIPTSYEDLTKIQENSYQNGLLDIFKEPEFTNE